VKGAPLVAHVEENLAARVPPPDEAFLEELEIGRVEGVEQRDLVSQT
jgi:hypothetical protein